MPRISFVLAFAELPAVVPELPSAAHTDISDAATVHTTNITATTSAVADNHLLRFLV